MKTKAINSAAKTKSDAFIDKVDFGKQKGELLAFYVKDKSARPEAIQLLISLGVRYLNRQLDTTEGGAKKTLSFEVEKEKKEKAE